ncbi:hypothetical protein AB0B88_16390 [Micromonospora haikouensis]|uniref:hypothetical protein n=1 Tax=Actinomycetes TaxID=1760 RepID=UPI00340DA7C0
MTSDQHEPGGITPWTAMDPADAARALEAATDRLPGTGKGAALRRRVLESLASDPDAVVHVVDPKRGAGIAAWTTPLPTADEMIANADRLLDVAYRALGDAGDELRSDWRPGTSMTSEQAGQRARMQQAITKAKAAINEGRR